MITYDKKTIDNKSIITLNNNGSRLSIIQQDDSVTWSFIGNNGSKSFVITMDDSEILDTFLKLYIDIKNGELLDEEDLQFFGTSLLSNNFSYDYKNDVKDSLAYNSIFNNGVITYKSDGGYKQSADFVEISKGDDYIMLEFDGIRSSTTRSVSFKPKKTELLSFAKPFIRQAKQIAEIDFSYHQYNIYDLPNTISKKMK